MSKVQMEVIGAPFRGVAVGGTVNVSLKDSRLYADNLKAVKVKANKPTKVKKTARKAPAKKASNYSTRAMKAAR